MATAVRTATAALLVTAGLSGAAGVVAAAVASHAPGSSALTAAAQMLMVHAAAAVGVVATGLRMVHPARWLGVAAVMLTGAVLFGGDMAIYTATGSHLFPMAAPTGGTLLILGWLALAGVAVAERLSISR